LYFGGTDVEALERTAVDLGTCVSTAKAATYVRIHSFSDPIGAARGELTPYVRVECTSGTFHGRPISESFYARLLKRARGDRR
jgi:hypothetical protein